MQLIYSPKGISLPIAIGLVLLLMTASAAVNQLIIRTLRSVHQIEASTRAYAIAEAGIEDALYELSANFAGYETPALDDAGVKLIDFGGGVTWQGRWQIQSHDLQDCTGTIDLCGDIFPNRKLALSFFNDKGATIQTLDISAFQIQFKVPSSVISANNDAFSVLRPSGSAGLLIDNDGDFKVNGVNEDGESEGNSCPLPGRNVPVSSRDADCDGKEDEDSLEDPVIYWKLLDNAGHTLVPKKGCLNEPPDSGLPSGSELCEKNFVSLGLGSDVLATLDETAEGVREDDTPETIATFLNGLDGVPAPESQLQMEFLIVAPLEQVDESSQRKIPIPALMYEVNYEPIDQNMPAPYFVIQSDGNYKDFKQSITTTLTPKTSVPLSDFTLIQQQ